MEIKVEAVDAVEQKSQQEIENELLQQKEAEEQTKEEVREEEAPRKDAESTPPALTEEQVLTFLKERHKGEYTLDDLFKKPEAPKLSDTVDAFNKYHSETGRGIEDYYKLQRDFDSMDEDALLAEYKIASDGATSLSDARELIDLEYGYDEDVDDEKEIKKKKLEKRNAVARAKKFFNEQKEKYKMPLESRADGVPEDVTKELEEYRALYKQNATAQEEAKRQAEWFTKKTDEVFTPGFKGFEFKVGEKAFHYLPGEVDEVKKMQSNVMNIVSKFLDEKGYLKDPSGYHKALAAFANPDKLYQTAYEQGKADAVEGSAAKAKNIDMTTRSTQQATKTGGGVQVAPVGQEKNRRGNRLVISKPKK